jgi:Transposase DDE domain
VVINGRSCRLPPSCFDHGIDGGKKIQGVKIHVAVDKYGIPLAIDVSPANRHDTKGIVSVQRTLADGGSKGPALGDLGYRGERLAKEGEVGVQPIVEEDQGTALGAPGEILTPDPLTPSQLL